ncbi:MAG TPA: hypothetical protein VGP63_29880, partial [Planctomycetaceae bacterium]|nr:hypothetical protein [Planctomycetaceae bacterium]
KISDRAAGWGYSLVTLIAFLGTLYVGLAKSGARPSQEQEFYGESFARLKVEDLPPSLTFRVAGSIPQRADGEPLPMSVQQQLSQEGGEIVFRGWMSDQQSGELAGYKGDLEWSCNVEKLFDRSQPASPLGGKVSYLADYSRLAFRGFMTDAEHDALLKLGNSGPWTAAVEQLWTAGRAEAEVSIEQLPAGFAIPESMHEFLAFDATAHKLEFRGPMSVGQREILARDHFPLVRPSTPEERAAFLKEVESHGGELSEAQAKALDRTMAVAWSIDPLITALNDAGHSVPAPKSACELYLLQQLKNKASGTPPAAGAPKPEPDVKLNDRQRATIDEFARNRSETVDELAKKLRAANPTVAREVAARQGAALQTFFATVPTVAEQKLAVCIEIMRIGHIPREQRDFLRNDYREQSQWRQTVGDLFVKAHKIKYPWSGQYNSPGSWFGWAYEYIFKPCTATMFSLLAFYVASAAFRAFRAKNVDATLLLGTAFIILLSQTFAGYWLTSWLPSDPQQNALAWLRMENLKILIMRVFNTAGTRAIMIGIALGLASTSIKIMLGQDRSYVGRD